MTNSIIALGTLVISTLTNNNGQLVTKYQTTHFVTNSVVTPVVSFKVAAISSEPPYLPMNVFYSKSTDPMSPEHTFYASALQPTNNSLLFSMSDTPDGPWIDIAFWNPYPIEQDIFVGILTQSDSKFIRAKAIPVEGFAPVGAKPIIYNLDKTNKTKVIFLGTEQDFKANRKAKIIMPPNPPGMK